MAITNYQKLINLDRLTYFKAKMDLVLAGKVNAEAGKTLSSNDYTSEDKAKLTGIDSGAQVNVIEGIQIGGTTVTPTNKIVNIDNVYTKAEVDQKLVGGMTYKGTVATVAALPASGNKIGDVYHVSENGSEYAWNGTAWEELGQLVDLSLYVLKSELGLATNSDIDALFT